MMIRKETFSDKAALESLVSSDPQDSSFMEAIRKSEKRVPELSLVYEDENHSIKGHISFCETTDEQLRCLLLCSIYPDDEEICTALAVEAARKAKELGYDRILVYSDKDFYIKKLRYVPAYSCGIFFPDFQEYPLKSLCLDLSERKLSEPFCIHIPGAPNIKPVEPIFDIRTSMSEEKFTSAVFNTRKRSRILEYLLLSAVVVICAVLAIVNRQIAFLGPAAAAVYFIYQRCVKSQKYLKNNLSKHKEKHNDVEYHRHFLFFDKTFAVCSDNGRTRLDLYQNYHFLYLKKDYLFFGFPSNSGANMLGEYIMYKDIMNKESFIAFLKDKTTGIRIMK